VPRPHEMVQTGRIKLPTQLSESCIMFVSLRLRNLVNPCGLKPQSSV
jgi:hypothetical protein